MNANLMPAYYLCPLCQQPLSQQQRSFRCEQQHCFDLAKEGYLNLLPVQFKHSKDPGDNKAMVNARRSFLSKGYYQPLADKLISLYQQFGNNTGKVLDAGCGEGFYSHQHQLDNNQVYGVDIAKEAIKKAAKKYPQNHYSVATLSNLPFADQYFNWIVSIYAPILEQEFTRILAENGYLITVTPAKKHLIELKSIIYQDAKEHDMEKEVIEKLTLVHKEQLSYPMVLATGEDALNLLSMTPFAFKASTEIKEQLSATNHFHCQADFLIKVYRKAPVTS